MRWFSHQPLCWRKGACCDTDRRITVISGRGDHYECDGQACLTAQRNGVEELLATSATVELGASGEVLPLCAGLPV